MSDWYVGQKVVCIANEYYGMRLGKYPHLFSYHKTLTIGEIYTIRRINDHRHIPGTIVLLLMEKIHPRHPEYRGFPTDIFRPLLNKPTDISIFTEMLNTTNLELVK